MSTNNTYWQIVNFIPANYKESDKSNKDKSVVKSKMWKNG